LEITLLKLKVCKKVKLQSQVMKSNVSGDDHEIPQSVTEQFLRRTYVFPKDIIVYALKNRGLMVDLMEDLLKNIWEMHCGALCKPQVCVC
jgi:hypothetical protein